ncbi:twin-arginine translocase TatA/TatE family subunit [Litorimonas sp. RW-G-Af-16]|uniref:twin-arginine translocase TatA/TatE family subunit n=1 Tax=Litorimonas sp. RW-G-Af-16 TaxID=3241168 RepID=UPI00390C8DDE
MGGMHPLGWLLIGVLAIVVFGGRGRISNIMGDVGKGITSFRKGLKDATDDSEAETKDPADDALDVSPKNKTKDKTK